MNLNYVPANLTWTQEEIETRLNEVKKLAGAILPHVTSALIVVYTKVEPLAEAEAAELEASTRLLLENTEFYADVQLSDEQRHEILRQSTVEEQIQTGREIADKRSKDLGRQLAGSAFDQAESPTEKGRALVESMMVHQYYLPEETAKELFDFALRIQREQHIGQRVD